MFQVQPSPCQAESVNRSRSAMFWREGISVAASAFAVRIPHPVDRRLTMAQLENTLTNADIAPISEAQRTWSWYHFAALGIGMVIAVPAYMLAGSMIDQGLSGWQAVGIVLLGNVVVLAPILLIGHGGARYGVPFAVLVRTSFGVLARSSLPWRGRWWPAAGTASRPGSAAQLYWRLLR